MMYIIVFSSQSLSYIMSYMVYHFNNNQIALTSLSVSADNAAMPLTAP